MLEKNTKQNNTFPIINERIQYPEVRLLDENGVQIGILSASEALGKAISAGLDLVLVSDRSNPPVCKIIDYGKYRFTEDKKAKAARKKQHNMTLKEVKMRYKIEEHDYKVRINQALRFLRANDKVKATITFRGREIQHINLALELLNKMAQDLKDDAEIQNAPSRDGKNIVMILSPKKTNFKDK